MTFSEQGYQMVKSAQMKQNLMPVHWMKSPSPVEYPAAVKAMEARVAAIAAGQAAECIWLLEHPPLYTAGTSARDQDLIDAGGLPVFTTGRGGQYTYHGPGQRIAYVMLDIGRRGHDVRLFVQGLENWLITTLAGFDVRGRMREGRVGVWVDRGDHDDKIAAIGIRLRKWISFHGISLNVNPELEHYRGIVPCGITGHGVTSLADLGIAATMEEVDVKLLAAFSGVFGAVAPVEGALI
jgi:lipoyl(octanoyl) transferase